MSEPQVGFQQVNEVCIGVTLNGKLLRDRPLYDFVQDVLNDVDVKRVIESRVAAIAPKQD